MTISTSQDINMGRFARQPKPLISWTGYPERVRESASPNRYREEEAIRLGQAIHALSSFRS